MAQRGVFLPVSVATLFLLMVSLCIFYLSSLFSTTISSKDVTLKLSKPQRGSTTVRETLRVYLADLPREMNYGLVEDYWSKKDSRAGEDADEELRAAVLAGMEYPPYPVNPLIKQYSAEYWLLADLLTPLELRANSVAKRVWKAEDADVIFVPFFATLSAEMQLDRVKGKFRRQKDNEDYQRQRKVVDLIKSSAAWRRSGGRDHVFVLTGELFFSLPIVKKIRF